MLARTDEALRLQASILYWHAIADQNQQRAISRSRRSIVEAQTQNASKKPSPFNLAARNKRMASSSQKSGRYATFRFSFFTCAAKK